ncbi:MAG: hypothetical protein Q4B22_11925 [Eubacteriales bacterium]|nr:hypothetical protein [Eubacteriales bacterium]
MTSKEARRIEQDFYEKSNPSDEEIFLYTEAMDFLIAEENKPMDMMRLGGFYYDLRKFDLALKYYEMASVYGIDAADECLGYIWYYGRTGERDYRKAFEHYSRSMDRGNLVCTYKVADMYKNGYYVEKNYEKYKEIIEELYPKIKTTNKLFDPLPEIYTRLARIRTEQKRNKEAIALYLYARDFLAQRIRYNAFFGNLNIMKWLIDDLYELMDFDEDQFGLFDLYYLLKSPHKISFEYEDEIYWVESLEEEGNMVVRFGEKWYRDRDDFFAKACIDGEKLTALYFDLDYFEVN